MDAQLIQFGGTLSAALLGGLLVFFGDFIKSRRQERKEIERKNERDQAIFTGLFAIRNHLVETVNNIHESDPWRARPSFESALRVLGRLVDKVPPDDQRLAIVLNELLLKLDASVAILARDPELYSADEVMRKIGKVLAALEQFDLISGSSLDFVSEDELRHVNGFDASNPGRNGPESAD